MKLGFTRAAAKEHVDAVLEVIAETLTQEETILISNFGRFEVAKSKARNGRNLRTGEPMPVPARPAVRFRPSQHLRQSLTLASIEAP